MQKPDERIAIIGAGICGLSAAYDLRKAGKRVTIFEGSDQVGGLAAGYKQPHWNWSVERYYHHWFQSDVHMLGLIKELGWLDDVVFPRPKTVIYYREKFFPFDSIVAAILYPGLGWGLNKVRFGLVGLYLRITKNWKNLEGFTADAWMRKWAGSKVYESMWEPMMIGKFGEKYAKQVNMAWLWARLHSRTTKLGTFKGGFQSFADRFADLLRSMGVNLKLESAVNRIVPQTNDSLRIEYKNNEFEIFEKVLVTLSPNLLSKLAPDLPDQYLEGLKQLKSMGAVVLTLALSHQFSPEGYYWYNIPKSVGFPFLSLVEHTNFVSSEHFGGDHILYVGDYLEIDHPYFSMDRESLIDHFLPFLSKINPQFSKSWIKRSWLSRTGYAQPIPMVNHSKNIPEINTPVKGLYYASMSQVYPWDRGTNYAVEIGRKAASLMNQ